MDAPARGRGAQRAQAMVAPQPQAPPPSLVSVEAVPLEWEVPQAAAQSVESLLDPAGAVVQAAPTAQGTTAAATADLSGSQLTLPSEPTQRAEALLRLGVQFNPDPTRNAYVNGQYTGGPLDNWQFLGVVHPELDGPTAGRPELRWQLARLGGDGNAFFARDARAGDVIAVDYGHDQDSAADFAGISDGQGNIVYSSVTYGGVVKLPLSALRAEGYTFWALPAPGTGMPPGAERFERVPIGQELGIRVAPSLENELRQIYETPTGRMLIQKAKARGLHTIRVGPLPGNTTGLYQSSGVITIESPDNVYTFQRLVHELLHAAGHHPHYFPDKGMVGEVCGQAGAACPSW